MLNIKNYVIFLLSLYLVLGASCKGSNKVESENNFMAENQELRDRLDDQARANQAANDELRMLREELRKEQDARMTLAAELESKKELSPAPVVTENIQVNNKINNIEGVKVSRDSIGTKIIVSSDVLFSSGSATLTSSAKKTLSKITDELKANYQGSMIELVGHTDTKMMKPSTRKKFKDNMGLGYERAKSVRDHLNSKGIPSKNMKVSSRGSLEPMSTDAASRRVEIIVLN